MQWLNHRLGCLLPKLEYLVLVPTTWLSIQLPASEHLGGSGDGSTSWAPATCLGDQIEFQAPDGGLGQPGPLQVCGE